MNKADLISKIALNSGLSKKDSEKALAAAIDAITDSLKAGEKVQLVGFGIFDVKERAAGLAATRRRRKPLRSPRQGRLSLRPARHLRTPWRSSSRSGRPGAGSSHLLHAARIGRSAAAARQNEAAARRAPKADDTSGSGVAQ